MRQLQLAFGVVLLVGVPISAGAATITYDFTASVTVSKVNNNGTTPDNRVVTPFEDALWFPQFTSGQTYQATGQIDYDPSLIVPGVSGGYLSPAMISVFLGPYTFTFGGGTGFGILNDQPPGGVHGPGDSVTWLDCCLGPPLGPLPPIPPNFFAGRDADLSLLDPTGTALTSTNIPLNLDGFSGGTLSYFGEGAAADPTGVLTDTLFGFQGTVTNVQRTPEPGTLSLLAVGGAAVAAIRRKRKKQ